MLRQRGGFCQCDACRALDEKRPAAEAWHATYSRRLAIFNNEVARGVARKYPHKLLKVGAYERDRLVDVHRDVRFLIDLPDRKPILQ